MPLRIMITDAATLERAKHWLGELAVLTKPKGWLHALPVRRRIHTRAKAMLRDLERLEREIEVYEYPQARTHAGHDTEEEDTP